MRNKKYTRIEVDFDDMKVQKILLDNLQTYFYVNTLINNKRIINH